MSGFALPIQQAIYTRLSSEVSSATTYDAVAQLPEGQPAAAFPYIVIGNDTTRPWDTDDTLGDDASVTLHVWSRYHGKLEAKTIMQDIYEALHRQAANLAVTGYRFVDILHEYSDIFDESDGVTRHGVCRYRLKIEKE